MVLQIITGFLTSWIEQSWILATLLVKYMILYIGTEAYLEEGFDLEHFSNLLQHYSSETVVIVTGLGLTNLFIGLEIDPMFRLPSQLITMAYFGFLFWKY